MNSYGVEVRRRRQNLLIVEGEHEKNQLFWLIFKCFPEIDINMEDVWVYGTNIYMLYEDVDVNEGVNGCMPNLYTVADLDNDQDNELILTCAKYSNQTPVAMLYEFRDNAFEIKISNQ